MRRHFKVSRIKVLCALVRVLVADLIHAGHDSSPNSNVDVVNVSAFVVHDFQSTCKLLHRRLDRLIVADCPALNLHNSRIQRPLICTRRREHRPSFVHQESHRSRDVMELIKRLRSDRFDCRSVHQNIRLCQPCHVDNLCVILLVSGNNIVEKLLELLLADSRSIADCFFNLLRVDAMRTKRPDCLNSHFVQLVFQCKPTTYLIEERIFQSSEQLCQILWERIKQFRAKGGMASCHHLLSSWPPIIGLRFCVNPSAIFWAIISINVYTVNSALSVWCILIISV